MAVRKRKPTSPGAAARASRTSTRSPRTRPRSRSSQAEPKTGGRNVHGRMTARHRGGGHKQQYRVVDFRRNKDGVPAKVARDRVRPEPQRAHRAAALRRRREALHPRPAGRQVGRHAAERPGRRDPAGQRAAAALHPGRHRGPQRRAEARRRRQDGRVGGRQRPAHGQGRALRHPAAALHRDAPRRRRLPGTVGVGRQHRARADLDRQGRPQPLEGQAPAVRGVAMNPVDHPLGGGEGKTSGGRIRCRRGASPKAARARRARRRASHRPPPSGRVGGRLMPRS